MNVTRYHNKKEMSLSKTNIFMSLFLIGFMSIVFYFKDTFSVDGINNYHLYLIVFSSLSIIFIFVSPYILYFDTFKSKLNITENSLSFKDDANMFNLDISRSDIKNIDFASNKVILTLKNNKTFSFEVENEEDLKNISLKK